MIRTVLVDDEQHCRETLSGMLSKHFSDKVDLLAQCTTVEEGVAAIKRLKPQLIFLDVEIGNSTGFNLLQQLDDFNFEVILPRARVLPGCGRSPNMVAQARKQLQSDTRAQVVQADLQTWPMPAARFSRVTARLVLHYLPALEPLLQAVHAALRPGGRLVFSVEHPVLTCCDRAWRGHGLRQEWIVDDYFRTGERETDWIGSRVRKYHRTVEDHFLALQACGFMVESLREGRPERARFQDDADFERRQRIPLFLVMAAHKAPASAEPPAG